MNEIAGRTVRSIFNTVDLNETTDEAGPRRLQAGDLNEIAGPMVRSVFNTIDLNETTDEAGRGAPSNRRLE
ncbi:MAG: hypothetical protein WDO73_10815 [Ignavibacteriota bacterium]